MTLEKIGVGAGQREGRHRANILRLLIGQAAELDEGEVDQDLVLEANLDDVTAEVIGYVYERRLSAGALDVYATPVVMKKSRPGTLFERTGSAGASRQTLGHPFCRDEHVRDSRLGGGAAEAGPRARDGTDGDGPNSREGRAPPETWSGRRPSLRIAGWWRSAPGGP